MGLFGKTKGVVGLDIGSSAVKACELVPTKGGGWEVVNLGVEPLAPEAIVDGTILDSTVVIDAITNLFENARIKTKDVATSVSGNSVIIKKIALPVMTEEELAESIQWEAEQYIPFDIEDVNIDYQILGESAENMDVLLVAAKKDKINDYTQVISQAGLNPVLVDVDAFAVQGAFEANYEVGPDEGVALVNVGASIMNINILKGESSVFWRDISSGGNKYTEEIQRELHLSQEQAEELKRGEGVEGVTAEQAAPVLEQVTGEVATEIQKTFDFFMATSGTDRIHRIVLAGGTSKIGGLDNVLAERFGAQVEILNPFEQVEIGKGVDEDEVEDDANYHAISVGCGLRNLVDTKINLLREKRTPGGGAPVRDIGEGGFQPIYAAFAAILLLALGYIGFDYYSKNAKINELTTKKAELETEKRRLEPIAKEKEELERKQKLLERKISIIKELKTKQNGPVLLLDELSRALPEYVWFRTVSEENFRITMEGLALSANHLAEFIENLKRSGRFAIPDPPNYRITEEGVSFRLVSIFSVPQPETEGEGDGEATTAQAGAGR